MSASTRSGQTQNLKLFNTSGNTYVAVKNWENITTLMYGVGVTTYQKQDMRLNTSVRFVTLKTTPLDGYVWQLYSPRFQNLSYTYQLKSNVVLLENSFSWSRFSFEPGLILGLGRAENKASHYQAIPLHERAAAPLQGFADAKTAQLAYEVGALLDYNWRNTTLNVAYRWIGTGVARLGHSPHQTTQDRLSSGQIYYQTVSIGARLYYDYPL